MKTINFIEQKYKMGEEQNESLSHKIVESIKDNPFPFGTLLVFYVIVILAMVILLVVNIRMRKRKRKLGKQKTGTISLKKTQSEMSISQVEPDEEVEPIIQKPLPKVTEVHPEQFEQKVEVNQIKEENKIKVILPKQKSEPRKLELQTEYTLPPQMKIIFNKTPDLGLGPKHDSVASNGSYKEPSSLSSYAPSSVTSLEPGLHTKSKAFRWTAGPARRYHTSPIASRAESNATSRAESTAGTSRHVANRGTSRMSGIKSGTGKRSTIKGPQSTLGKRVKTLTKQKSKLVKLV